MLQAKAPITVRPCPIYEPNSGEVLVKVDGTAIHPLEAKLRNTAFYPLEYPVNLGMTFAGIIESVGTGVTNLAEADHVAVLRSTADFNDRRMGGHQRYAIARQDLTLKVKDKSQAIEAAANFANIATAVAALTITAGMDRPSTSPNPANASKKVLVYGGTSQLGRLAVQYVKQAGYSVVTTSSPRHRDAILSLSPLAVVDHTAPSEKITADLLAEAPYDYVFDTISVPVTYEILTSVLLENKTKGGTDVGFIGQPGPAPKDGIELKYDSWPIVMLGRPENAEVKEWFFKEYMPATFDGAFVLKPAEIEWVKGGLHGLQGALDRILQVSGKKMMHSPWDESQ